MNLEKTSYGKEHKLLVYCVGRPRVKNAIVFNYDEEFQHYKDTCKTPKKRQKWATKEGFQLEWNASFDILKKGWYIYPGSDEVEAQIRKSYKVIEEN